MKSYLTMLLVLSSFLIHAQSASRTIFTFNTSMGLNSSEKDQLESTYFTMHDDNYHCFEVVSSQEKNAYPYQKQLALAKQRTLAMQNYYQQELGMNTDQVFIKYGGEHPTLWLHKPDAKLTVTGEVQLDDQNKQCFSYASIRNLSITTDHGNRLYFPKMAFETMDGKAVTANDISICLWEFADKKSLIFSNLTTSASGKMLETGGSFYLEASWDGKPLKLRKGVYYTIELPTAAAHPDMFTYYGYEKDGLINWAVDKQEPVIVNGLAPEPQTEEVIELEGEAVVWDAPFAYNEDGFELESEEPFYSLTAGKLGWINCDRFYDVPDKSTLALKVDTKEPVIVRLVFRDIESVMECYSDSNHKNKYVAENIPTGEKVLVLAYSVQDDQAVLGYKEVTIGENSLEQIELAAMTKSRFESAVRELLY
ncbi:MAG: hypothetical protein KDD41_06170 [Flavobacteriales bacterium]|nr:hypothetical protein [Flavobacteriales bacterium]